MQTVRRTCLELFVGGSFENVCSSVLDLRHHRFEFGQADAELVDLRLVLVQLCFEDLDNLLGLL